jgi:hypothetical protein
MDLLDPFKGKDWIFKERVTTQLVLRIREGIYYLQHSAGVIHGDLSPASK